MSELINKLKYVPKIQAHFVRLLNNFPNSYALHVISLVMNSRGYVGNFQPVSVAKTGKFPTKKEAGKIDDF